jgi:hypothetical protein
MTAVNVSTTGTAIFSGPFSATSGATFDVSCPATFDAALTADMLTVNTTETVTGKLTASGGVDVTNGATIDTLAVGGVVSISGKLTAANGMEVQGVFTVDGSALPTAATVNGNTIVNGDLTVNGNITGNLPSHGVWGTPKQLAKQTVNRGGFSASQTVDSDGFFIFTTDNGMSTHNSAGHYFAYCFKITIGGMTVYTSAAEPKSFPLSAYAMVPVKKGDSVSIDGTFMGTLDNSFYAYMWLVPFASA